MRKWRWVLVFVVVVLGVIFSRPLLFFLFETTFPLLHESDLVTRPHPQYGMELRPNLQQARIVAPARPHTPEERKKRNAIQRRATFFVNSESHGFRSPEVRLERPPQGIRIACLGDSTTFGWGVGDDQTYPTALRRLLEARFPGRPIEVINAGIPGNALYNLAPQLEGRLAPFHPDAIIVMKYGDLRPPTAEARGQTFARELRRVQDVATRLGLKVIYALPPVSSFDPRAESALFQQVLQREGQALGMPALDFTPLFAQAGQGRGLKLEADGRDQRLVRYTAGQRAVILEIPGVPAWPVSPKVYAWLDQSQEREALFFDEGHPDEEGNQLMAKVFLDRLLSLGWVR